MAADGGFLDDVHGQIALFFRDDQRRNHSDDAVADGGDQQPLFEAQVLDFRRIHGIVEFDTDEQALASRFLDVRDFPVQFLDEVGAHFLCIAREIQALKLVDLCQSCGAADRVSAKGGAVGAGGECFRNFFCGTDGADRHAASQCLRHGDDVWLDAVIHVGHQCTGSAPAGLNLIQEKQEMVLIAVFPEPGHEFFCGRIHTAFALYRLDHDGNGVFRTCIDEGLKVIESGIGETGFHRTEALLTGVVRLPGCGHGAEGSAVEAVGGGDDVILGRTVFLDAVFPGHLDHGFVGFCSGVLIKNLVHSD